MKILLLNLSILILSSNGAEIFDKRISGGHPVNLGEVPFFAFIQMIEGATGASSQCGGSLIRCENYHFLICDKKKVRNNY
jgi:secreted trypsin-like serine protease